jgi:hypothetical protein
MCLVYCPLLFVFLCCALSAMDWMLTRHVNKYEMKRIELNYYHWQSPHLVPAMFRILYNRVLPVYLCIRTLCAALVTAPALQSMLVNKLYWIGLNYQHIQEQITILEHCYFNNHTCNIRNDVLPDATIITSSLCVVVCGWLLEEFSPIYCAVSVIGVTNNASAH